MTADRCTRRTRTSVASPRAAAILDGKAGGFDETFPALDLVLDLRLELRAGFARDLESLRLELLSHGGIGVRRLGGLGEPPEHIVGHPLFDQQAEPDFGGEFRIAPLGESRSEEHTS